MIINVDGNPVPQGSMRAFNNRVVHSNSPELKAWRARIHLTAIQQQKTPLEGPVRVEMVFRMFRPKTVKRDMPHVKPDLDKLARAVNDALTGAAFVDDSQIVEMVCKKVYDGNQGVTVSIYEL